MFLPTMAKGEGYTQELACDEEGTVRIKATCNRCGEPRLVNVADGSLWKWERNHQCGDLPENLINFPAKA